jgi:hypothetical protein
LLIRIHKTRDDSMKRHKGATLIELMVAMALFFTTITIVYAAWQSAFSNFYILSSHTDARREVRQSINPIIDDVRNACYAYAGNTYTMGGITYTLPHIGTAGNSLILSIPENDNTGSVTYTVVGYYLLSDPDPLNPNAYKLMRFLKTGVTPATADDPTTINLNAISTGETRVIARYIDASQFKITVGDNGNDVTIAPLSRIQEKSGQKPVEIKVVVVVNLRNKT